MRHGLLIFTLGFFAIVLIASVAVHAARARGEHSAAIVTDEENGVVRIMIDGRAIMTVNSAGLSVDGNVTASLFRPAAHRGLPAPNSSVVPTQKP
jgi:hypothetical protein